MREQIRWVLAEAIRKNPIPNIYLNKNRRDRRGIVNSIFYPADFFNINSGFSRFPELQRVVLQGDSRGRNYRFP
jgi:hypothetical protein